MNILVATIPHSGTHVLRYMVLKAFFQDGDTDYLFNGSSPNKMIKCHVDQLFKYQKELENLPVFTSLRHPRRIAKSFEERREKFGNNMNNYSVEKFNNDFYDLMNIVDKRHPFYLHVDHPIRTAEVELFTDVLDMPVAANFEVCRRSGAICGNHDIDIDQCPDVKQEFIDFYYETIKRMENHVEI